MIIFRYLAKEVFAVLFASVIVLQLVFMSTQLIQFMKRAAWGVYPIATVLHVMALQAPFLLGFILPLGMYLGILMAYSKLYADSEMTVLFACGVSRARIIGVTLCFAVVVTLFVGFLTLWAQPKLAVYQEKIIAKAIASSPLERAYPERFETFKKGKWVFYIDQLTRDRKHMKNVFVAQEKNTPGSRYGGSWQIMTAKSGYQEVNPKTGATYIILNHGHQYDGMPGNKDYEVIKFAKLGVHIPQQKWSVASKIRFLPTSVLWHERKTNLKAAAEIQLRLSMPLSVMLLAFLAIPLSRVNPRQGRFAMFLPAILIYVVYADMVFISHVWVKNGDLSPIIGTWWVHVLLLLIAIALNAKQMGKHQIMKVLRFKSRLLSKE